MKTIALLAILMTSTVLHADPIERTLMLDYVGTDMDRMFEIKTSRYQKVILDCQSYMHSLDFYNKSALVRHYYLDFEQCEDLHSYLTAAKEQMVSICFEIENGALNIVEADASECI